MTTPPKTITVSPDATVLLPDAFSGAARSRDASPAGSRPSPRPAGLSDTALCPCGTDRCIYEGLGVVAWQ
ncbi:hypothetical protein [Mycolicibacterium gilvum]|uniref:hypothetical protein n=1 Tax=Mycolicibacterium gilvum TaxID=1804 RepID=UPI004045C461